MPEFTVAVTEPLASSTLSFVVAIVSVALPLVGMVTVRDPVVTPKSPVWLTAIVTDSAAWGAGLAVKVKTALPPSVMSSPAVMLTSGICCTTQSIDVSALKMASTLSFSACPSSANVP